MILKLKPLLLIVIFTCIGSSCVYGQNLSAIKINGFYSMPFDQFLDSLTINYNLKFDFDREALHKVDLDWAFLGNPLDEELKTVCKVNKLIMKINENNVISIVSKEALRTKNIVPENTTGYIGPSEKKNINVTGRVVESKSLESLPFVTVSVNGTALASSSNADGFFTLVNVPTDTSTLKLSYLGYSTRFVQLNPKMDLTALIVGMVAQSQELKEVTVQAEKEKQDLLQTGEKPGMIKMTPQKLDALPNLGEKDIFRSFQLMPGVSAANESSSGLYVRGSTPDQALVLYDGFTIYHVDHLFGFFSAFNANAIKDVQLYRGGFESKFGGRLGSVAEITGNDGNRKKWDCGFDVSLLGVNLWLAIPIKEKFTSLIAFRTSYEGYIYNLIYKKFDNTSSSSNNNPGGANSPFASQNSSPTSSFYDLNVKLGYKFGKNDLNNISLSIFNSRDNLDNSQSTSLPSFGGGTSFSSSSNDITKYGSTGGSLKYSRKYNEKIYGNTLLSVSEYNSNRDVSRSAGLTDSAGNSTNFRTGTIEHNTLLDLAFKTDYEFKLSSWNKLEAGILFDFYHINYSYSQNDTSTIVSRDNKGTTSAFYIQDNFSFFKNKLNIMVGNRFTYYNITAKPYFEPRANLDLKIARGLKFQAATGLYYQFANRVIREDILQGSKDFWVLSDGSKIHVSSSVHYIAGFNYEYKWFTFSAEGYYKNLYNLSQYSLRLLPSNGKINYNESFYTGSGIAKGIDFTVMAKVKGYNGWVTYTLGKVDYNFAAFGGSYPADQDVRHEFKTTHTYKLWRFDFSATWVFSTGKPYTAPQGGYQLTLLDGTTQSYINVSQKNGERLPNYHRMDIAIAYRHPLKTGGNVGIGFSIFNLYNRTNVWYRTYQIENDKVIQTNVNYLGIIPNVTLSFKLR